MIAEPSPDPTTAGRTRLLLMLAALPAVAGVLLVLGLALIGSENQLLASLKDDGYYYLVLARNIAAGNGATFDGLGPTNGFHPLWTLCLTPLFIGSPESLFGPVRAMILLALVIHLGAALAIRQAVIRIADSGVANLTALLYVGNPLALYLVVSGMESPAVALVVALLAVASIRLQQGDLALDNWQGAIQVGVLCGLCMLARTELILLAGLVLAQAFLWAPGKLVRSWSVRIRWGLTAGLSALAVVAPWLAWNFWRFGSVVQVSAQAHKLHSSNMRDATQEGALGSLTGLGARLESIHRDTLALRLRLSPEVTLLLEVALLAVAVWWIVGVMTTDESRRQFLERLRWLAAPILYAGGFLGAAFLILGHFRSWYAAGPLTVAAILVAMPLRRAFAHRSLPRGGRLASRLVSVIYVLGMLALGPIFIKEINYESGHTNCWSEAAAVVAATTTEGQCVASFNSGTFGYLSPRQVVNLDCVVNNRALPYLAEGRLPEFVTENGIRYIIDDPRYVVRYYRFYSELGWDAYLAAVDTLASGLVVYEVR